MTLAQLPRPATGVSGVTKEEGRPRANGCPAFVVTTQPGGFPRDSWTPAFRESHGSRPNCNSFLGGCYDLGEPLSSRADWSARIRERPFPVDSPLGDQTAGRLGKLGCPILLEVKHRLRHQPPPS
jgi:hypothetical protein